MIVYDPKRRVPNWAPGSWQYLETLLKPNMKCFEWGGGQSTLWLAERVPSGMVLTVENKLEWLERTYNLTAGFLNCDILWAPRESERYLNSIDLLHPADVYLIDGFQRPACLKLSLERCKTGDIIVMDDALDYAEAFAFPGLSLKCFQMPHPHAGKLNLFGKISPDFKETWVFKVP